jgi:nucleoside permease NupC
VASGYKLAHNTFVSLKELEEYEKEYLEKNKIVIKFECKQLGEET